MTPQEMIDVIQHHMNGGEVEVMRHDGWGQETTPCWNFHTFDYRKKPEPKTRLLTIKELWGKTLIHKSGEMFTATHMSADGRVRSLTRYFSILNLFNDKWKLAGHDLCYETATSLEVSE